MANTKQINDSAAIIAQALNSITPLQIKNPGAARNEQVYVVENALKDLPNNTKFTFGYRNGNVTHDFSFTKDANGLFQPNVETDDMKALPKIGDRSSRSMAEFIQGVKASAGFAPVSVATTSLNAPVAAPVAPTPVTPVPPTVDPEAMAQIKKDTVALDAAVDRMKKVMAQPATVPPASTQLNQLSASDARAVAVGFLAFFDDQHHGAPGINNYNQIDIEKFIAAAPGTYSIATRPTTTTQSVTYSNPDLSNASPALKDKIRDAWSQFREAISEPAPGILNGGRDIAVAAGVRALEKNGAAPLPKLSDEPATPAKTSSAAAAQTDVTLANARPLSRRDYPAGWLDGTSGGSRLPIKTANSHEGRPSYKVASRGTRVNHLGTDGSDIGYFVSKNRVVDARIPNVAELMNSSTLAPINQGPVVAAASAPITLQPA